eukprot:Hpha_TRINITY_DN16816_c1_g1::TRINITY_DN16816_c1_g1_i16::g.152019::m.152019
MWAGKRKRGRGRMGNGLMTTIDMTEFCGGDFAQMDLRPAQPADKRTPLNGKEALAKLHNLYVRLDRGVLRVPKDCSMYRKNTAYQGYSILPRGTCEMWELLDVLTEDAGCNAAVGALMGLTVGDAVGHPLEFISVDAPYKPSLLGAGKDGLEYERPKNRFRLREGQWTDDASMALCLADSLLARGEYHGGDARVRWLMWWGGGYNNAFRHNPTRRVSVGLGGNICDSLVELEKFGGKSVEDIPRVYESPHPDAGNGSIMRLAPVPIHYYRQPALGEKIAALQSRATHPGPQASVCCIFMTFLTSKAIRREMKDGASAAEFVDASIEEFCDTHPAKQEQAMEVLHTLLRSEAPTDQEACWNWKTTEALALDTALQARRKEGHYNGYGVSASYFGSYCMDGLAMALWAFWNSRNFDDCLSLVVNLLGDADTTGAIACQMAGAFYGYKSIRDGHIAGVAVRAMRQKWDPHAEIGLRAAMLYHYPSEQAAQMMMPSTEESGAARPPHQEPKIMDMKPKREMMPSTQESGAARP